MCYRRTVAAVNNLFDLLSHCAAHEQTDVTPPSWLRSQSGYMAQCGASPVTRCAQVRPSSAVVGKWVIRQQGSEAWAGLPGAWVCTAQLTSSRQPGLAYQEFLQPATPLMPLHARFSLPDLPTLLPARTLVTDSWVPYRLPQSSHSSVCCCTGAAAGPGGSQGPSPAGP